MKYGKEIWKAVVGFEGLYEVSSYGKVRSLDRNVVYNKNNRIHFHKGQILSQTNVFGYRSTSLCKNGVQCQKRVHVLMAIAFHPNPENKRCVNHKDGKRANNHIDNLEWFTHLENMQHAVHVLNSIMRGVGHTNSKLTEDEVRYIKKMYPKINQPELARQIGISQPAISCIILGKTWQHIK